MSDASKDVHKLLKELEGKLHELPIHLYIMIWAVTEMAQRMKIDETNPRFIEICYPFTKVPLFTQQEAKNLEDLWLKNIKNNPELFNVQKGGKTKSIAEIKKKAEAAGQALATGLKSLDPNLISPDYLYQYSTELFDTLDSKLTTASGDFGILALENTMVVDPVGVIPTVPPTPFPIPGKSIFPVINAVLEALRITCAMMFRVDPWGLGQVARILLTLVMTCLDLARGNLYHAIFTAFGFMGNNPMYIGIILKIMRDAIMLISPDLRTDLRDLVFKSSKSFILGFAIWAFTTMSPQLVKKPIAAMFMSVSTTLDKMNEALETSEKNLDKGPLGKLATIQMPKIPMEKIPDVNNLYALREAIREPSVYCSTDIKPLLDELRGVPPYALFFDLALIPRPDNKDYPELCKPFLGKKLEDNVLAIIKDLKPEIKLIEPEIPGSAAGLPNVSQVPSLGNVPELAKEGPNLSKLKAPEGPNLSKLKAPEVPSMPEAKGIKIPRVKRSLRVRR